MKLIETARAHFRDFITALNNHSAAIARHTEACHSLADAINSNRGDAVLKELLAEVTRQGTVDYHRQLRQAGI